MSIKRLTFDEIMAYDKRNYEVYLDLLKRYKDKGIIPFVGAGMSVAAGFMTWESFLNYEYNEFMDGRVQPSDPLDAASEIFNSLGAASFRKDIVKAFGGEYSDTDWSSIIKRIQNSAVCLLPKLFHDVVVTTNFDRLLEHIYPTAAVSHPGHDGQLNRAVQIGSSMIFKLHGCVSEPEEIILTRESYTKAYPKKNQETPVVRALEKIITVQTVLFLGCSLKNDDTVKHWAEMIAKPSGKGIEHFTIINCTPEEKQTKRRDLGNMNIYSILYDGNNHDAVRVILEQLYLDTNGGKPLNNLRQRNEYFTGRHGQLKSLHKRYDTNVHTTQIISGLGGVGKTQTALEYAHMHLDEYLGGVWWLNAESDLGMMSDCRDILIRAGVIDRATATDIKIDELLNRWQYWLSENINRLLIFDNVENERIIFNYLPKKYRGHLLFTTRNANWYDGSTLELPPMLEQDAVEFMLKRTGRQESPDTWDGVKDIVERLSYLPLALEQAAAYIKNANLPFRGYLNRLNKYGLEPLNREYSKPNEEYYKKVVATTWQVSFDLIEKKNKSVSSLFNVFAYTDSNNIPLDVFAKYSDLMPDDLSSLLADDLSIDDVVVLLRQYSLIERDERDEYLISIHRLVQEVVRDTLKTIEDNVFLDCCFYVLSNALPREYGDERSTWVLFERISRHANTSAEHYLNKYRNDTEEKKIVAHVFIGIGFGYYKIAQYENSLHLYKKSLEIFKEIMGEIHSENLSIYNKIAEVYHTIGDYYVSIEWCSNILAMYKNVSDVDRLDIANTYNIIAQNYQRIGEYSLALRYFNLALAIHKKLLSKEDKNTAAIYNNIADVYNSEGAYHLALKWYNKSTKIKEKKIGRNHPDTAITYNNIAMVNCKLGKYQTALIWNNKALKVFEDILGQDHPHTATTYNNIAGVFNLAGEYVSALEWYKKARMVFEKVLGSNHPDTATIYNNIAGMYYQIGNYSMALEWYEKALEAFSKIIGNNHPDIATTHNNIAGSYYRLGNYSIALEWWYKALEICEKALGKEHPDTAAIYNNIAVSYDNLEDYQKALEWNQKALIVRENELGKLHPDTAITYDNIAGTYNNMRNCPMALEWHNKALSIRTKILRKDHPDIAITFNNIGSVYVEMSDYTTALEFYNKALVIRLKELGEEHPNTASTFENISLVYVKMGDFSTALNFINKALSIREKTLGKDHPLTISTAKNIGIISIAKYDLF